MAGHVKKLRPGFMAVERKSVSIYQYCRYPAKWLNHRNLQLLASRGFRFCLRGHRCAGADSDGSELGAELERCQPFASCCDCAVDICFAVCGGNKQSFVLRRW